MSSNIKVISPYIQQNGGDSVLTAIELSSQNSIKEISLELGSTATNETYTISLTGATGSISVDPKGLTFSNLLQVGQRSASFLRTSSDEYSATLSITASGGMIYTESGIGLTSIEVSKTGFTENTTRDISHLYNVNFEGKYLADSNMNPLQEDKTSFALMRTNPKLTGNVKLTVDSATDLWLNSIEATKELSDDRFRKVAVSYNSNYTIDVRNFFDNGATPPEIVYSLYQESSSYFSTQRSFASQYDRFYTYGASQLKDKSYDEDYAFFAPLRIDDILPDYFVIFRTDGPFNPFTYNEAESTWKSSINAEIIKKSSIVKTFDLSIKSKVGRYIRNLLEHPARKNAEMTVSFQQDGYTTFNGIEYSKGSFAQKGELLSDFYATPNTVIGLEEFLSLGFERNSLLSPNILNMEFLFDDADAEDYTINRYFGLYLSTNQLADFFLSDKALSQFSASIGQTPVPRAGVQGNKFTTKPFIQNNPDGIKVFVDSSTIERNSSLEVFNTIVQGVTGSSGVYFAGEWETNPYLSVGDAIRFTVNSVEFDHVVTAITQDHNRGLIEFTPAYTGVASLIGAKADFYTVEKEVAREKAAFDNEQITDFARIFYVQDKNGDFYNVNGTSRVQTQIDNFNYREDIELSLVDRKIDISNFTGTNEMLTQTAAEVLISKGKASLELEITNAFQEGDTIEVSWYLPNTTEPTRWVIAASSTQLMPGEVWPDPQIFTGIDGTKYYYTTFHPGISTDLDQVAITLKRAFDIFPFRIFDTVVEGKKLYLKSRVDGEASNDIVLTLDMNISCIAAYGFQAPDGISTQNFLGGTEKPKKRAKILKEIASGILNSEFFKTVGSYSKLRQFSIWGNPILYFTSVEEEVYIDDILVDFSDKADYAIIEIEDDAKFDVTFDGNITSYNLYRGKYGVFSIFPIRDFDSDYFTSDYAKNYDAELLHYFQNSGKYGIASVDPVSGEVILDRAYTPAGITGPFDVPFIGVYESGQSPKDYNGLVQLHFPAPGFTANAVYYTGPTGNWNLFSTNEIILGTAGAPEHIVPLPEDKILYFEEDDLSKFKGFFSLSSIVSEEDLAKFSFEESQWDFNRFIRNSINTEYLRAYENYNTDFALTSKVVPYVCKWVSHDGKDVRDNPYRFNYNRAFGTMNFTPSAEYTVPDTRFHTHEWSYLANVPYYLDPMQYSSLLFSYFFEKPQADYDFHSVTRDWFSTYFTVGYPSELYYENSEFVRVPVETSERYSVFKYDPLTEKTYTMFRGVRLEIAELISDNSSVVQGSDKYVDYKFSSVIVPIEEDDSTYNEPIEFDIIVNEKFKFILNLIKIKIATYKNPEGNISYVDLYTLQNKRDRGTYAFDNSKIFSPSVGVIAFNYNKGVPSDVMLDGPVNFVNGKAINPTTIDTTEINPLLSTGDYTYLYGYKQLPALNSEYSAISQDITAVNENNFTFESGAAFIFNPILKFSSNASALGTTEWIQYNSYYASGGDNYYTKLRNLLSFYEISRALTGLSDKITPLKTKIAEDGTVTTGNLAIQFGIVSPEQVVQMTDLIPLPDDNKPPQLYSYPVIGMELTTYSDPQFLYRYQGDFVPKFRDVFHFAAREEKFFSLLYNSDFRLANTLMIDNIIDSYQLSNQFFNKVADEEILRIPPDSGYQSLYPAVDEISIDKKDLFVWNSSWDQNYYRKYSTVSNFAITKGTVEMKEIKSFLASKMMKLPKSYSLYNFLESEFFANEKVSVDSSVISKRAATKDFLTIEIDIYSKFLRELKGTAIEERAKKEFLAISAAYPEVIDPSEVDKKVDEYLRANVIELFEIDRVNFYVLETGNDGAIAKIPRPVIQTKEIDGKKQTYSEKDLYAAGYKLKKDVKTIIRSDLKIQIQIALDSRYYTSVGFGIDISRI
jgi:hypothetical protein